MLYLAAHDEEAANREIEQKKSSEQANLSAAIFLSLYDLHQTLGDDVLKSVLQALQQHNRRIRYEPFAALHRLNDANRFPGGYTSWRCTFKSKD